MLIQIEVERTVLTVAKSGEPRLLQGEKYQGSLIEAGIREDLAGMDVSG